MSQTHISSCLGKASTILWNLLTNPCLTEVLMPEEGRHAVSPGRAFLDVDEDGPAGPGSALLWTKGVALTVDRTWVGFGCIKASIEPFFIFWILSLLALVLPHISEPWCQIVRFEIPTLPQLTLVLQSRQIMNPSVRRTPSGSDSDYTHIYYESRQLV